MVEKTLPKPSVVKVGKLFTMHRNLIARKFGNAQEYKLQEVLDKLRLLFARSALRPAGPPDDGPGVAEPEQTFRTEEIDQAVLALLHLNSFQMHGQVRSWKTFDWDAMDRLFEKGLIDDPRSKAKSVPLTAEGIMAAEEAFRRRFA